MIYLIVVLSLLFTAIGFLLTEKNARYLLAGYNTMPEKERRKVDLKNYISFFRNFHLGLGLSFLVIGSLLSWINKNAGGIFLIVYPIVAYIYLIWRSRKFYKGTNKSGSTIGVIILVATLLFVVGLVGFGYKEDSLIIKKKALEIEGFYGETITVEEIESIELVNELPEIVIRTNGFALGSISKGYFKTREGEIVKLMLHSHEEPYILIKEKSGDKIYFSSKDNSMTVELWNEIKETWPRVVERGIE